MRRVKALGLTLLTVSMLWAGAAWLQQGLTKNRPVGWYQERMSYLPSNDLLRPLLFGYESTYANYLWIKTTLYLGSHYLGDKQYPWLVGLVDMVTMYNPRFYPAYEFAGVLLPDLCHNASASRVILHRGLANVTHDKWKLAFYLGSIHLLNYGEKSVAADYFALAAQLPGAPVETLARTAAAFYTQTGERERGVAFLRMIYQTTDDPAIRQHLMDRLKALYPPSVGGGS